MKFSFLERHISTKTGQDDALTFMDITIKLNVSIKNNPSVSLHVK